MHNSGQSVFRSHDAAGRTVGVSNATTNHQYVSGVGYAPQGALSQYSFGNGIQHKNDDNSRLQMGSFTDSYVYGGANRQMVNGMLTWATASAANNGNLRGAQYNYGVPGAAGYLSFAQSYDYDGMNRLTSATEGTSWAQTFAYDAVGTFVLRRTRCRRR